MAIKRFTVKGSGRSDAVISNGLVYAVATDPYCADGIIAQTRNTLKSLDRILENAGSSKAGLVQATVYLADISEKPHMDSVWIEWIGAEKIGRNVPVLVLS